MLKFVDHITNQKSIVSIIKPLTFSGIGLHIRSDIDDHFSVHIVKQRSNLPPLIVVIMSHGTRGTVEASNGLLDIHDVLMTMSSKKLAGKPKVRQIQQCGRVFNNEISECQLFAS